MSNDAQQSDLASAPSPTYALHCYLSDDDSESEYDYYVPPTKPTASEFRARLEELVDDIIAAQSPGQSAFDERNWDPQALAIMDFPSPLHYRWEISQAWRHGHLGGSELCEKYASEEIKMVSWDSTTVTPAHVEYWRWENYQSIMEHLLDAEIDHSLMRRILERSPRPVAFGLAGVGLDVMGYLVLACRRLLHLKSGIRGDTAVYPEERFASELKALGNEIALAMLPEDLSVLDPEVEQEA
jgi:hypothetical protein